MLGGVTLAGARSQKASAASPDTKEQLLRQSPPGFHHGSNVCCLPKCGTKPGRGLAQVGLRIPLTIRPGPMAKEQTRKSAIRGDSSAFMRGNRIFARRDPPAANTMSHVVQWPMVRMRLGNHVIASGKFPRTGSKNHPGIARSNCGKIANRRPATTPIAIALKTHLRPIATGPRVSLRGKWGHLPLRPALQRGFEAFQRLFELGGSGLGLGLPLALLLDHVLGGAADE